jgi:hypothetical protein
LYIKEEILGQNVLKRFFSLGSPTSAVLQQVLTQAITQALSLPDTNQAGQFLQAQINNAFGVSR